MRKSSAGAAITVAVVLSVSLSSCGEQKAVPDVVGLRLDDAHNVLKKADFSEFEDADVFDDRAIFIDSNWVVLEQTPAADERADPDDTVALRVGKIGEDRTRDRLPDDSPVLAEIRADEAEEAAEAEREAAQEAAEAEKKRAERAAAVLRFVNDIDPVLRLAQDDLTELATVGASIRSGDIAGDDLVLEVADAHLAVQNFQEALSIHEPDGDAHRDDAHERLASALDTFDQAVMTLLSADGPGRSSSLQRFDDVYTSARDAWNAALEDVYASTDVQVPRLP